MLHGWVARSEAVENLCLLTFLLNHGCSIAFRLYATLILFLPSAFIPSFTEKSKARRSYRGALSNSCHLTSHLHLFWLMMQPKEAGYHWIDKFYISTVLTAVWRNLQIPMRHNFCLRKLWVRRTLSPLSLVSAHPHCCLGWHFHGCLRHTDYWMVTLGDAYVSI